MEGLLMVAAVAAVVGAVMWNHKNQAHARAGHRFEVPAPPDAVTLAIGNAYCSGGRAAVKGLVTRVRVTPSGPSDFRVSTKIGDGGRIEVRPSRSGSVVHAYATELHIGGHPMTVSQRSSLWGLASRLGDLLYTVLGISVNAARMKHFQRRVENQVGRQLRRASAS